MAKVFGDVCDVRYQLFHNEMIKKENAIRMKWFLKNQERLISQLKEPKFTKQAREMIAESKKQKVRVDKSFVKRKPLPLWRPLRPDGSINTDVMKPVDPDVRAMLYEKGVPSFIATDNYLTKRYKKPPEERYYFPDCTNWRYGWRLDDYPPIPPTEVGLQDVMLAQFYRRKAFNLKQDPEWYRGCQTMNARNFNELLIY